MQSVWPMSKSRVPGQVNEQPAAWRRERVMRLRSLSRSTNAILLDGLWFYDGRDVTVEIAVYAPKPFLLDSHTSPSTMAPPLA